MGTSLIQVLAALFHISRGESSVIGMNLVLLLLAVFIAWGRTKKVPILTKIAYNIGEVLKYVNRLYHI
jgi:hypothetical protein